MDFFAVTPYVLLLVFCLLLAWIAQRYKKIIAVWLIIVALTLFAGLRANSVGIDTMNYVTNLSNGYYRLYEIGFQLLSQPFALSRQPQLYLLCIAAIIYSLFVLRLWELRHVCDFAFSIFLFVIMHFSASMNTMRQYIACAIVFWGTRFLFQRKAIPFIVCVLVAMCFHKTSFISMGFLLVYFTSWRQMSGAKKVLSICLLLALPAGLFYIYTTELSEYVAARRLYYFANEGRQGLFIYFEILMMLLIPFMNRRKVKLLQGEQASVIRFSWMFGLFGLGLSLIGYQIQFMGRAAIYYAVFTLPLYSVVWKQTRVGCSNGLSRTRVVDLCTRLAILCVTVSPFILQLVNNSYSILPYVLR